MTPLRAVGLVVALAALIGLWVWPLLAFPNPGFNDAMLLANLTLPVVGAILIASIVFLIVGNLRRWSVAAPVALGTFLIGVAVAFVVGLLTIGNMSNDRFAPLLFLPIPFVVVGIVVLAAGVGAGLRTGKAVRTGLVIGGLATALLLAWILARGAGDWLLAPYGFDVLLLIALESTIVYVAGATWAQSMRRGHPGQQGPLNKAMSQ